MAVDEVVMEMNLIGWRSRSSKKVFLFLFQRRCSSLALQDPPLESVITTVSPPILAHLLLRCTPEVAKLSANDHTKC